jgi:ankyrin repeat protein
MARFRWAACQLEELKRCMSPNEISMTLSALPATLDDTYAEIFWNIPDHYSLQVLRILQWLVHSKRPLRLQEIAEVISAGINNDSGPALDGRLSNLQAMLSMLPNLVTTKLVANNYGRTEEHVQLAHFSVQEYLVSDRIRDGPVKQYAIQEERAHESIARTCLAYLLQFDEPGSLTPQVHESYPLSAYAAKYWAEHARKAENHSKEMNELIMQLFHSKHSAYINFIRLLYSRNLWKSKLGRIKAIPSPLYYASLSGLTEAVKRLLEKGADTGRQEGAQGSALHVASARGNVEIVKLVLEKGASPNQKNKRGETPLALAAIYGYEKVVEILLAREDVDLNTIDEKGLTPLSQAARCGHEKVVKALLKKHGVCVNNAGHGDRTSLSWAAEGGHIGVVSILLKQRKSVDPIAKDAEHGYAAMEWALLRGDEAALKVLLKRRELVILGQRCARPIQMAVIGGRASILKLLLEKGFRANAEYRGRTALMRAVIKGNEEIIKLLLEVEHVNPNFQLAADGRTALMVAAENFRVGAVRLLLSDKRVNRHLMDRNGSKALSWARNAREVLPQYGEEFDIIIKMLTYGDDYVVNEESEEQECPGLNQNSAADYESMRVMT